MTVTRRRYRGLPLLLTLSFVTALFATGVPALLDRSQTSSLRQALAAADSVDRAMIATTTHNLGFEQAAKAPDADALEQALDGYAAQIPAAAAPEAGQAWDGVQLSTTLALEAQGTAAQIDLEYRDSPTAHVRLLAGALPDTAVQPSDTASVSAPFEFDVALSAATAKLYGAKVGSVLTAAYPSFQITPHILISVRVTGIFEPTDPSSAF